MATTHKGAEHHVSAANHHEQAAHHHRQAAKHYQLKEYAHAAHQAQIAYGHINHAVLQANEAAKYHAEQHGSSDTLPAATEQVDRIPADDRDSYERAISEGWPISRQKSKSKTDAARARFIQKRDLAVEQQEVERQASYRDSRE